MKRLTLFPLLALLMMFGLQLNAALPPGVAIGRSVVDDSVRYQALKHQVMPIQTLPKAPRAIPAASVSGKDYAQWDDVRSSGGRKGYTGMVHIDIDSQNRVTLSNFYNLDFTIKGTYDPTTGAMTFPSQFAYKDNVYGDFWLCYFDVEKGGFSSQIDLVFQVDDSGVITSRNGWVIIIPDRTSSFYGSAVGMSAEARFNAANAKMTGRQRDIEGLSFKDASYPLYVYQPASDQLVVANFANMGKEVVIQLNSDKTIVAEPQMMLYSALVGAYCTYPASWSATKNQSKGLNKNLEGTGSEKTLSFGPWGVFRSNALTNCLFGMEASEVTLDSGSISWPGVTTPTFTGAGTETDPYKIANVADLLSLSAAVAGGEKFAGKYFQQTADLDMAANTGRFRPIGVSATAPFEGVYNGDSHEIKNLVLERGPVENTGLFGYAGEKSEIKNLKIRNARVQAFGKYSAPVVGRSLGRISNVSVTAMVSGYSDNCGGVAGSARKITDSDFLGTISSTAANCGGIAGELVRDTVTNCHVHANITAAVPSSSITHGVGGIIGSATSSATEPSLVEDCYYVGSLKETTGYAHTGGVVGSLSSGGKVFSCSNMGLLTTSVTASSIGSLGGIVGNSYGVVEQCMTTNSLLGTKTSPKIGGIVGLLSKLTSPTAVLRNNANYGQVMITGVLAPEVALYGKADDGSVVENNYVDAQMAGMIPEGTNMATASLVSGTLPAGLDPSSWKAEAGRYPVKKHLPADLSLFSAVPVILNGTESAMNVKSDFRFTNASGIDWKLLDGEEYVTETKGLRLDGDSARLKGVLSYEFLVAMAQGAGGTYARMHYLSLAPAQFEGNGSADKPYLIKTPADLKTLYESVALYNQSFEGDFFRLANDIDMTGVTGFYGIGSDTHFFNGTLDGAGHKIDNWRVNGLVTDAAGKVDAKNSLNTIALVANLGEKGILKNIILGENCDLKGNSGIGGICAVNAGTIENCRNYAAITGAGNYVAGIAVRSAAGAKVIGCYNAGPIRCGTRYVAGITADMKAGAEVKDCQNDGDISALELTATTEYKNTGYAGGVVGVSVSGVVIADCANGGNISAYANAAGIVAGYATGVKVNGCVNTGIIAVDVPDANAGAIAGDGPTSGDAFTDCWYDAQICTLGGVEGLDFVTINRASTSDLTSGTPLKGLSEDWAYEKGKYPVLKAFASEKGAAAMRSIVLTLAPGETTGELITEAALNGEGVKWELPAGVSGFAVNGQTLKLSDITAPVKTVLTATTGAYTRAFTLTGFSVPFDGKGTEAEPFMLRNAQDMQTLSDYTTIHGARYAGKYFAMVNDIDFKDVKNFRPIGWAGANRFDGTLDGRGHSVKNLTIDYSAANDYGTQFVGLFGTLGSLSTAKNIVFEGGSVKAETYAGALAGRSRGVIDSCVNKSTEVSITKLNYCAGLVAFVGEGKVTNCINETKMNTTCSTTGGVAAYVAAPAEISGCSNSADIVSTKSTIGGVVADCYGCIHDCVNTGNVSGAGTIGGVAGSISSADSILNLVNRGTITATGSNAGGVAGSLTGTAARLKNYGKVEGASYNGGIAGYLKSGSNIADVENHADITGTKTYTGGIVGSFTGSQANHLLNTGNVSSKGNFLGGLVGGMTTSTSLIDNSVNHGAVTSEGAAVYAVGGIAGSGVGNIRHCANLGDVKAEGYSVGGIGGQGLCTITGCVNTGAVSTTYDVSTKKNGNAGGIWGHTVTAIYGCINYGDVTAKRYTGGILGYPSATSKVIGNYVSAKVTGADAATTGVISHLDSSLSKVTVDSCYYDADVMPEPLQSEIAAATVKGLPALDLRNAALGNLFDYHDYALPTVKGLSELPETNFHAAMLVFAAGESPANFSSSLYVETLPGLEWTQSDNIARSGNKFTANSPEKGKEGTITLKAGELSKVYTLILNNEQVGLDEIGADAEIIAIEYYTMEGIRTPEPEKGAITIRRTVYSDGKILTEKIRF